MEERGVPTVMICTNEFSALGRSEAESLEMPALPIALVPHPLGGQQAEQIRQKAADALKQVADILTTPEALLSERFRGKV